VLPVQRERLVPLERLVLLVLQAPQVKLVLLALQVKQALLA
jgi:hypothetical protein